MMDNVASVPTKGSGDQDPEVDTPEARRAAFVETIKTLGVESKALVAQKTSLGRTKGDAKTRQAIQARLADIEEATADYQKLLAAVNFELREAAPAAAGATTAATAAVTSTSSAAPAAGPPAKSSWHFKMPDTKLFPSWQSAGRTEPLDLRRWLLGVARVCEGHHFQASDWRTAVAILLPSGGVHQDWAWRRKVDLKFEPWEDFVEAFVAHFQQQSSLDLLERSRVGCPAARYDLGCLDCI